MRYLIYPALVFILVLTNYSQNKNEVLEIDEQIFKKILAENSPKLNNSDWEDLRQNALNCANEFDFQKAENYAKKAKILAEDLNNQILIARSFHLLGKVQPNQNQFNKIAGLYYQEALNAFTKVEKNLETRKWVGYIYNDLAYLNLNPEIIHSVKEKKDAAFILIQVFQMIKKYSNPDFLDLEILTSLNISNYFFIEGHIPSQIVWLETAEKLNSGNQSNENYNHNYFEINYRLQRAYRRIGDYQRAFQSLEKIKSNLTKYPSNYQRIEYLRQLEDSYADIGKTQQMFEVLEEGIDLSKKLKFRNGEFQTLKILRLLQERQINEAKQQLEEILKNPTISIEKIDLAVINAVIAGYENNQNLSDEYFKNAEVILKDDLQNEWINTLFLLNQELRIALYLENFERMKVICQKYLDAAELNNNKDSIPFIYLNLAKAEFGLNNFEKAQEHTLKAIQLIESKRRIESAQISIGVMEVLYEAYDLKVTLDIIQKKTNEAINSSDLFKSRWLYDRINNNPLSQKNIFDTQARKNIYDISLDYLSNIEDKRFEANLGNIENNVLFYENKVVPKIKDEESNLIASLDNLNLNKTAIISFKFTSNNELAAFVYRQDSPIQISRLKLTNSQISQLAKRTQSEIKNLVYYKNQGKELYDLLLKPLNIDGVEHLIFIPENSLWKIPFQALSPDGKRYLIESVKISYAPSISVLLNSLNKPKPNRTTFQVFSNSRFNNYLLQFADTEANSLALIYQVKPIQNATINQFKEKSNSSDIIHFSMHAGIEPEPFNSFLAFHKNNLYPNGQLTVADLLNIKLKSQSLVFLASCSTDNVFSSEGLISLAWGMMAAGATTVISAQWEANDESTEQFTKRFYSSYKSRLSSAEALQKASIEMINSNRFNKPYYWAEFTLNGDFR